jgi:hypothetical protein
MQERYQEWNQQAKERRKQLKVEELQSLDFHGFGGTIDGLRAFLAHKYSGGSARGWRTAIAPDEAGVKQVTKMQFMKAMYKIGYAGHSMTLWKALSRRTNGQSAGLEDLEPDLALQLDGLARIWAATFRHGGAFEAWPRVRREHAGRATLAEFANFLDEMDLLPDDIYMDLRRVFDVLAFRSSTTLTRDDLRFLDQWAHTRLKIPLPAEEVPIVVEPERYSPPPPKAPPANDLAAFREFLKKRFGSPARAWRQLLDVKGAGSIGLSDFGTGCRQAGWKHPHAPVWKELSELGGGLVTMRALDPDTCGAIEELITIIKNTHFGDVYRFWDEAVDPSGSGTVSQKEFITDLAKELQMSSKKAHLIFMCLDTQNLGWVAVSEIGFIDLCARKLFAEAGDDYFSDDRAEDDAVAIAEPSTGTLHNSSLISHFGQSRSVSDGALTSPLRGKAPVNRPTRSTMRNLYFSSHKLKHRWMRSGPVHDRCTHSSSEVPKTEFLKWTEDRNIFRASNEFYREGVKLLATAQRKW